MSDSERNFLYDGVRPLADENEMIAFLFFKMHKYRPMVPALKRSLVACYSGSLPIVQVINSNQPNLIYLYCSNRSRIIYGLRIARYFRV